MAPESPALARAPGNVKGITYAVDAGLFVGGAIASGIAKFYLWILH